MSDMNDFNRYLNYSDDNCIENTCNSSTNHLIIHKNKDLKKNIKICRTANIQSINARQCFYWTMFISCFSNQNAVNDDGIIRTNTKFVIIGIAWIAIRNGCSRFVLTNYYFTMIASHSYLDWILAADDVLDAFDHIYIYSFSSFGCYPILP